MKTMDSRAIRVMFNSALCRSLRGSRTATLTRDEYQEKN